jgi:hypothetical protein
VVTEIIKKPCLNNVTLYWIPGHAGPLGNQEAYRLAKAATIPESEEHPQRDSHPWYLVTQILKRVKITAGPLCLADQRPAGSS